MSTPTYCLRPDVVVEPLVARWHAWTHLISPAAAALNTAYRHVRTMESYVAMPMVHAAAAQDPALLGGPFIDLGGQRVDEVRALLDETRQRQAPALRLAEDINALWRTLADQATGHALAPLYERLPDSLRGMVEIVYTPAGAPDLRLNEPLLYRSPCYDPSLQGAMMRRVASDQRAFVLSTPRLDQDDALYLDKPFADPVYDFLGALRLHPKPLDEIAAALELDAAALPLLQTFLTEDVPPPPPPPARNRWRYFGHACVLVETASGKSVLVDPLIAYENGSAPERFTAADLPERIDYVVITHNHQDHVLIETLLSLRWKIGTILVPAGGGSLVDPSLKLALQAIGFDDVREIGCLETVTDEALRIQALPFLGEHADLDIRTKAAWLVEAGDLRLIFAADSNNLDPAVYARLKPLIGRVDTLFLGMECQGAPMSWLYGCLLPFPVEHAKDQSRRLDGSNFARARAVIETLEVPRVCIYAMGLEPWLKFISSIQPSDDTAPMRESLALLDHCKRIGLPAERLYGRAEHPAVAVPA